ncbi:hypothetical protein AFL01nite_05230 [Aeromicrobium flavum]|uniref:Helix-turn-helix domain-containing protein n=1 Tax=Aeromicrobium flavum TaxID=416568 RepID=A0A512HRX4_9ACTN|nr:helix-turn-helix domain-containing protein [Aeromicrobium flavum]GEO88196.1 hypothetical protein AFL01nite_05230 [Aeromicrobium flavum]
MTDTDVLLDTDEAARMLRLPPSTLKHFRQTEQGPSYVKLGRRVYYRRAALVDFLASSEVTR